MINRRNFLQKASASLALSSLHHPLFAEQSAAKATFSFSKNAVATMPVDFTGLSYESPQLANPGFFSAEDKELVKLFRELGPTGGVLRTGGNLSAFTGWRDDPSIPITPAEQVGIDKGKRYWEWDLTDPTIRNGNHEAVFTPASIETLAAFLEATGWRLLYGLNFGTGTPQQAAAEAACVQRLCGKNLLGFQLGNEIDYWTGGLRPRDGAHAWNFDNYYAQWREWVRIIRASSPNAPFAGPDVAENLSWMEQLAEHEKNGITMLTKHHYAMGPAGDPKMNAAHLFGPDPAVAKEIASAQRAKAVAGVGFRTAECNSCYHGGQPGVSNAYASALWGADYMLTLAQGGHAGVNLHGGGEGIYSPITGDPNKGFTRQPLFFGMKFAQLFAGATFLEGQLNSESNLTAYAATRSGQSLIGLINRDPRPSEIRIIRSSLGKVKFNQAFQLSAPSLDSKTSVRLETIEAAGLYTTNKSGDTFSVPPYAALFLHYS